MKKIKSSNISNIEKYHNFYQKKPNKSKSQKGGNSSPIMGITSVKSRKKDAVNILKFDISDTSNTSKSYFIKLYLYHNEDQIKAVKTLNNLLKLKTPEEEEEYINTLQISDIDIGKGYYEILFYKKFYNLTKNTNNIKVIKPIQYDFINYSNLNDEIIVENNKIKIKDILDSGIMKNQLDHSNGEYYSILITEYDSNLKTLNDFSYEYRYLKAHHKTIINKILYKILDLLNFAYKEYNFIHRDLHWGNILINANTPKTEIKSNDIYFFDFDLSQIGGLNNIGLFIPESIDSIINIDQISKLFNLSNTIPEEQFKKQNNIIYKEFWHAYDYFRLIYEMQLFYDHIYLNFNVNYREEINMSIYTNFKGYTKNLIKLKINIIKDYNLTEDNIYYLNRIFNNIYERNILIGIYFYMNVNPDSILNEIILSNINTNTMKKKLNTMKKNINNSNKLVINTKNLVNLQKEPNSKIIDNNIKVKNNSNKEINIKNTLNIQNESNSNLIKNIFNMIDNFKNHSDSESLNDTIDIIMDTIQRNNNILYTRVKIPNDIETTILIYTIESFNSGNTKGTDILVKRLLDYDSSEKHLNPEFLNTSILNLASKSKTRSLRILKILLKYDTITPLINMVSKSSRINILMLLIAYHCDNENLPKLIEKILKKSPDPIELLNSQDKDGNTVLHRFKCFSKEILDIFLSYDHSNAFINKTNNLGETAIQKIIASTKYHDVGLSMNKFLMQKNYSRNNSNNINFPQSSRSISHPIKVYNGGKKNISKTKKINKAKYSITKSKTSKHNTSISKSKLSTSKSKSSISK